MSDIEKSEITEDEDKEQDLDEQENESFDESSDEEETSISLEDLRDEVADAYLTFLDTKKEGAIATAASLGVSLNPLRQSALDYMLAAPKEDEGIFDKIGKKFKKELLKKIPGGEMLEYDKDDLKKMKELIKVNKDNISALESIRAQIEQGIDPTQKAVDSVDPKTSSDTNAAVAANTAVIANTEVISDTPVVVDDKKIDNIDNGLFSDLVVGGTIVEITQDDINKVCDAVPKIIEKISIKGGLADIEKIKYNKNVIIECEGETPYINENALKSLIGFAFMFFEKTGKTLIVKSAYRTQEHQSRLIKNNEEPREYKDGNGNIVNGPVPTANVGYSGHNQGLSIDLSDDILSDLQDTKIKSLAGFQELAKKFNFNSIPSESWHFDHQLFTDQILAEKSNQNVKGDRVLKSQELDKQYKENRA